MKFAKHDGPAEELRSSRGAFLIKADGDRLIAQAWPRKRGAATSGYNFYRQSEFGIAARWASHPEPKMYQTAVEMAKGTQQVPRDIIMMAIMGTYYTFVLEDGTEVTGARVSNPNPQYILDLITDEVGSIIFRAPVGWVGLPPGTPGQILMLGPDLDPQWVTAEGSVAVLSGTWNPTIDLSTTQPTSPVYSTRTGRWIKLVDANLVYLDWAMFVSSKGSGGVGEVRVSGLPFTSKNSASLSQVGGLTLTTVDFPGGNSYGQTYLEANATRLRMLFSTDNGSTATATWANWSNGSGCRGSILYECEP